MTANLKSLFSDDPISVSIETKSDGTGSTVSNVEIPLGDTLKVYSVSRTETGDFVKPVEVSWVLMGPIGDLTIENSGASATLIPNTLGTGYIRTTYENITNLVTVTVITARPTPVISSTASDPTNLASIPISITFDQVVTDFDINDIVVTNGIPSNFSGSGTTYTFDLAPNADGLVFIEIPAGVATNSESTGSKAANTFEITSDRTPPILLGLSDDSTPTKSKTWSWSCNEPCVYRYVVDTLTSTAPTGTYSATATATQNSGTNTYYIHVQAIDSAGNESTVAHISAIIDNTAPISPSSLSLSSPSSSPGNDSTPAIQVNGVVATDTVRLYTDSSCNTMVGSVVSSGTTAVITSSALSSGSHTFYATSTDIAGNDSACSSSSVTYVLDNTAPTSPSGWTLSSPTDGAISNDTTPVISASGLASENGSTASVFSDSSCSTLLGSETISGGSFTINSVTYASDGSDDGVKTFYGRITDAAGNSSSCVNTSLDYTLDTQAPPSPSGWTLSSPGSGSTSNDYTPVVSATGLTGLNGGTASVYSDSGCAVLVGSATVSSGAFNVSNISFNNDGSDDGLISFYGRIADAAGNISSGCTGLALSYTLDTQGPTAHSIAINSSALYTKTTSVTLSLAATDAASMFISDTSGCTTGAWETMTASKSWTLPSTNSNNTVYAKFRDSALNETSCVDASILHDNVPPAAPTSLAIGTVPTLLTETPPLSWTAGTDSGSGVDHHEVQIYKASDNSVIQTWTTLASGGTITGLTLEASTNYYFRVRAVDRATNNGTEAQSANWTSDSGAATCTGTLVDGYCWHLTTTETETCNSICASKGGTHPATIWYSGSHGTSARCQSLLTSLGESTGTLAPNSTFNGGCKKNNGAGRTRGWVNTLFSAPGVGGAARMACACNYGSDPVPAPSEITSATVVEVSTTTAYLSWSRGGDGVGGFRVAYATGATAPADCSGAQLLENEIPLGFDSTGKAAALVRNLTPATQYAFRICAVGTESSPTVTNGLTLTATTDASDPTASTRAPTYVNLTTATSASAATSLTYSHSYTGTDRMLVVAVAFPMGSTVTVTGITYDSKPLTQVARLADPFYPLTGMEIWYLNDEAAATTGNVVISLSGSVSIKSNAVTINEADQTSGPSVLFNTTVNISTGYLAYDSVITSNEDQLILGIGSFMQFETSLLDPNLTLRTTAPGVQDYLGIWTAPGDTTTHLRWGGSAWAVLKLGINPSVP